MTHRTRGQRRSGCFTAISGPPWVAALVYLKRPRWPPRRISNAGIASLTGKLPDFSYTASRVDHLSSDRAGSRGTMHS